YDPASRDFGMPPGFANPSGQGIVAHGVVGRGRWKAVDVRAHRGALMLRIGVVAALVSGSLAAAVTHALDDAPAVPIRQSSNSIDAGETTQLRYRIEAGLDDGDAVNITVDISGGNLSCVSDDCGGAATLERQGFGFSKDFKATLKASDLAPGS